MRRNSRPRIAAGSSPLAIAPSRIGGDPAKGGLAAHEGGRTRGPAAVPPRRPRLRLTSETSKRIARKAERSGAAKPWSNHNRAQGPAGAMSQRSVYRVVRIASANFASLRRATSGIAIRAASLSHRTDIPYSSAAAYTCWMADRIQGPLWLRRKVQNSVTSWGRRGSPSTTRPVTRSIIQSWSENRMATVA
jgi:hypothetical protein